MRHALMAAVGAAALIGATGALAHGGGGGGGGGMGGMGGAGGMGSINGRGDMGMGSQMRTNADVNGRALGHDDLDTHSSVSALDNNSHAATALTNALEKRGITLPSGGLKAACTGFRNLGQCVAALHVAQNLSLPGGFNALKGLMTGSPPMPLGKAIQKLDPTADSSTQERTANKQASADMRSAGRG